MQQLSLFIIIAILLFPFTCSAVDLGDINKTLGDLGVTNALDAAGIDLNRIADCLDWETINISLVSDMVNTTELLGRTVTVDGKIYKKGISNLRVNLKSGIEVPGKESIRFSDCFILQELFKKKAYIVFPLRQAYVPVDPDEVRQMLGQLRKKRDGKPTIEKKEILGTEIVDGIECKKMHSIMTLPNGTRNDITAWLAESLKGFPLKIIARIKTPQGITGINTTLFSNIIKQEPEEELFSVPKDYVKYDNLVEVATEGKLGTHLGTGRKVREKRGRRPGP
jgi:hypothetical protein